MVAMVTKLVFFKCDYSHSLIYFQKNAVRIDIVHAPYFFKLL